MPLGIFKREDGVYDLGFVPDGNHLATDEGLRTAALISLHTQARALETDVNPGESRGGYWGDSYPLVPGRTLGSRVWTFTRKKATQTNIELLKQEVQAALKWMVDIGIAESIEVDIEFRPPNQSIGKVGIRRNQNQEPLWVSLWEASV